MSLDEVSAYLKIGQRRRGSSLPPSSWNISTDEQIRRGEKARKNLRMDAREPRKTLVSVAVENAPKARITSPGPVDNWEFHEPAPYDDSGVVRVSSPLDDIYPLFQFVDQYTPKWRVIILEVCNKHKIKMNMLLSRWRIRKVVAAKHEAMYRMRYELGMSFPAIGKRLGGMDHSSAIHGCRCHEERLAKALG